MAKTFVVKTMDMIHTIPKDDSFEMEFKKREEKGEKDGCWVEVDRDTGDILGCYNDGGCGKHCSMRSYTDDNGVTWYYCICTRNA